MSAWGTAPPKTGFDQEHSDFDKILKLVVVNKGPASQVKYKVLKANVKLLDAYLAKLTAVPRSEFDKWTRNQQMAFLANAYNAFTMKLIALHYPVKSIKTIGGFFSSPWKQEFFSLWGKKRNLNWIEHGFLRKVYKEPRLHFALNCASIGCPALRDESYKARILDQQLDKQARRFLSDRSRNYIKDDKLYVSKIFDWYGDDFVKKYGSVVKFIAKYYTSNEVLKNKIASGKFDLDFPDYNWSLNEYK